mmetsp:Transcript_34379/g.82834  ORF Transcript_34379/g.82834 Transcript_34379/m.82834 type:complete len:123 (+) Transcript_34379:529-897(+)
MDAEVVVAKFQRHRRHRQRRHLKKKRISFGEWVSSSFLSHLIYLSIVQQTIKRKLSPLPMNWKLKYWLQVPKKISYSLRDNTARFTNAVPLYYNTFLEMIMNDDFTDLPKKRRYYKIIEKVS